MLARLPRPPGRNLRIGTSEAGLCNLHESQSWQPAAAEAQLAKRSEGRDGGTAMDHPMESSKAPLRSVVDRPATSTFQEEAFV